MHEYERRAARDRRDGDVAKTAAGETVEAAARVGEFVRQRRRGRGLDPDLVNTVWTDDDAEPAELRLSDLDSLVAIGTARATAPAEATGLRAAAGVEVLDELMRKMGSPRITRGTPYEERQTWEGVVAFLRAALAVEAAGRDEEGDRGE